MAAAHSENDGDGSCKKLLAGKFARLETTMVSFLQCLFISGHLLAGELGSKNTLRKLGSELHIFPIRLVYVKNQFCYGKIKVFCGLSKAPFCVYIRRKQLQRLTYRGRCWKALGFLIAAPSIKKP